MTDKEKIKAEIKRQIAELTPTKEKIGIVGGAAVKRHLESIISFIDSLQEEPVSEDLPHIRHRDTLDEFAYQCAYDLSNDWAKETPEWKDVKTACKLGAQWQKEHLWKPADGDDLPEIDREVIAILDYDFGHYKVVYAHRPNPNGWNGTNIDTGEKEHFEPEIYDNGGWNQPHVLYWLDAKLPYEEK